jgi:hypothetical protein
MNRIKRLLVFLNNLRIRRMLIRKIRNIRKSISAAGGATLKPDELTREAHHRLWSNLSGKVRYDWLEVYTTVSGKADPAYVPEDIYYTLIEPRLNNKLFSKAWTDKNSYELFLRDVVRLPAVRLRCINGILYTPDFMPAGRPEEFTSFPAGMKGKKLVIKPTMDSGGGKAVRVVTLQEEGIELTPPVTGVSTLTQLFSLYGGNFIVQDYIRQDGYFARFNESSLNTVRVLTYRSVSDESVSVLHRLLRVGRPGSVVDNQSSGGMACAIDAGGRLMSFGIDKSGNRHKGTSTVDFGDAAPVPYIGEISAAAVRVASAYRYSRLLGLDFAVSDSGEVILIEVNDSNNEINFFQMSSGPLFGSFTEEVVAACNRLRRSFIIDYII